MVFANKKIANAKKTCVLKSILDCFIASVLSFAWLIRFVRWRNVDASSSSPDDDKDKVPICSDSPAAWRDDDGDDCSFYANESTVKNGVMNTSVWQARRRTKLVAPVVVARRVAASPTRLVNESKAEVVSERWSWRTASPIRNNSSRSFARHLSVSHLCFSISNRWVPRADPWPWCNSGLQFWNR